MKKSAIAVFLVAGLSAPATAQPVEPAPTVALDVFLEQRVAEELAVDGTILSRLGVALDIEAVGDKLIVSLIDPATRRAVASTKVDSVPADREAAVAAVTQVAANLAAQLGSANAPPQTAAVLKATLEDDRRERAAREDAEYKFRQEAIYFGSELAVHSTGRTTTITRSLVGYQGDMRRRLAGRDLYEALGRNDLADAYDRRQTISIAGMVGGSLAFIAGGVIWFRNGHGYDCIDAPDYDQCRDDWEADHAPARTAGLVLAGAGTVAMFAGIYYWYRRHPISESEIYDLGADHNAQLRLKYGLPVSAKRRARPSVTGLTVAPYAHGDGGGLSFAGRF